MPKTYKKVEKPYLKATIELSVKNMQFPWVGRCTARNSYSVSESGWMTHGIFEDFFKTFVGKKLKMYVLFY